VSDADDLLEYAETEELRETARRLQQKLAEAKAETAELIDTVYRAARDAAWARVARTLAAPDPLAAVDDRRDWTRCLARALAAGVLDQHGGELDPGRLAQLGALDRVGVGVVLPVACRVLLLLATLLVVVPARR
jgi:hypothetical protein